MPDQSNPVNVFLPSVLRKFHAQKVLAEKAITQLSDDDLRTQLHPTVNSTAIIMKHMAGNMLSRWTEFLTTDGEKKWRRRDDEFIDDFQSRDNLMKHWQSGWDCLFNTISSLNENNLACTITIRGEKHTVYEAIIRQIDHYGYHTGQIVLTARLLIGDQPWETISIPRGQSEQFNATHWKS